MTLFWLLALLLCALAAAFVLLPLGQGVPPEVAARDTAQRRTNIRLFKDRLRELEASFEAGELPPAEYQALKTDLERSLLADTRAEARAASSAGLGHRWLWLAVVLVPVLALGLYWQTGAHRDWPLQDEIQAYYRGQLESEGELKSLQAQVSDRLAADPDSDQYRYLRARLYMDMGLFSLARDDYELLLGHYPEDAGLWAQAAQAGYLAAGQRLTPAVEQAAERALQLNPHQRGTLGLLGMHYYRVGEFAQAVNYWERLAAVVDPRSPDAQMLQQAIASARSQIPAGQAATGVEQAAATGPALQVTVDVAPGLENIPEGTLFVFAKAVEGPPMPLAVARLQPGDWPVTVELDNSMAMAPGLALSDFDRVAVTARISQAGTVAAAAGDAEGSSQPLELGEGTQPVKVVIDRILP